MIVFDASTLILLAKAELLERFLMAPGIEAVVPSAVGREACGDKKFFDALLIQRLMDHRKIVVEPLKERKLFQRMREDFRLGIGEAEAIALGVEKKADLVATDDLQAIRACQLTGLRFTSALAVLAGMCEKSILSRDEVVMRLEALEREGRYKRSILAAVRSRLEMV